MPGMSGRKNKSRSSNSRGSDNDRDLDKSSSAKPKPCYTKDDFYYQPQLKKSKTEGNQNNVHNHRRVTRSTPRRTRSSIRTRIDMSNSPRRLKKSPPNTPKPKNVPKKSSRIIEQSSSRQSKSYEQSRPKSKSVDQRQARRPRKVEYNGSYKYSDLESGHAERSCKTHPRSGDRIGIPGSHGAKIPDIVRKNVNAESADQLGSPTIPDAKDYPMNCNGFETSKVEGLVPVPHNFDPTEAGRSCEMEMKDLNMLDDDLEQYLYSEIGAMSLLEFTNSEISAELDSVTNIEEHVGDNGQNAEFESDSLIQPRVEIETGQNGDKDIEEIESIPVAIPVSSGNNEEHLGNNDKKSEFETHILSIPSAEKETGQNEDEDREELESIPVGVQVSVICRNPAYNKYAKIQSVNQPILIDLTLNTLSDEVELLYQPSSEVQGPNKA